MAYIVLHVLPLHVFASIDMHIASCTYLHGLNLKILVCDHSLTIVFNINGGRIEKVMYSNRTSDCKSIMFVPLFFCG